MFLKLLVLFTIVPIAEVAILYGLVETYGFWPVLGVAAGLAVVGTVLVWQQGLATVRRIQEQLSRGQVPANDMLDGALILVAAALLITPGALTDLAGLLLLIPVTRWPVRNGIRRWLARKLDQGRVVVISRVDGSEPGTGPADARTAG